MADSPTDLKLVALDSDDLTILSAHAQDAVVRVGDMTFLKSQSRFAAVVNRFDWETAERGGSNAKSFQRRRAGLRFERVSAAQIAKINLSAKDDVLSLLAISFAASDEPAGTVTLHFSGGGAIRLTVECIEAELKDLGAAWAAASKPSHSET